MLARLLSLPLGVLVFGVGAAAMMLPAAVGAVIDEHDASRSFFYFGVAFLFLFLVVAMSAYGRPVRRQSRSHLIALLATYTVLPVMLAVPVYEAVGNTTFLNAWFEMVSSITTTGATLFPADRLPRTVHLWRAEVAWLGGFFIWVTAVAILAPMNLGGFEVRNSALALGQGVTGLTPITRVADPSERLARFTFRLFPIYAGLTVLLWSLLYLSGESPFVALCHAMSTLSTSGISPIGGIDHGRSGFIGEAVIFLFFIFALSRLTFAPDERMMGSRSVKEDPELLMGLFLVAAVTLVLVLRHWIGAIEVRADEDAVSFLRTLWGAAFTVASFLTTTGFESAWWAEARSWSGLDTPGLILMGLAVFGGGVATTAGGVKLLRIHALYKHGLREMELLVHPNSVGGAGQTARALRRQGAHLAWIFFMLFAMSIAAVMCAFAILGFGFEDALVLTIASLTTTGPITVSAGADPINLAAIGDPARLIFAAAMVVGRLETLALIALLNPEFWRP